MLVLSTRVPFQRAMERIAVDLNVEDRCRCIDQWVLPDPGTHLVVVDLGSNGDPVGALRRWHLESPDVDLVGTLPWVKPREETCVMLELVRAGLRYFLMAPDDVDTAAWRQLVQELGVHRASQELQRGLMMQVLAAGRGKVINQQGVLQLLANAYRGTTLRGVRCYTGVERRRRCRGVQRNDKELLIGFRWLWAVYLRERGWSAAQVAHLLGFNNSNDAAKGLFRTVPVGMRCFLDYGTGPLITLLARELVRCETDVGPLRSLEAIAAEVACQNSSQES